MKINNIYLLIASFCIIGNVLGQQDPNYILYRYNMNYINPAFAGAEDITEFAGNVRSQWSGVEGAPETQSFMAATFLGGNVGLGASIVNDRTFIETQTSVAIDFSYKLQWNGTANIYFGLKASANSYNANTAGLTTFGIQSDPSLMNLDGGLTPNVGAGVYFKDKKLAISFSVPKLLKPERLEQDDGSARLGRNRVHMYLMSSYDIDINERLVLKPSTMLRYIENTPLSLDLTTALKFEGIFEFGAAYRLNEGVAGYVLFDFEQSINIGYAYEASDQSNLANVNNGTHEIFLRFEL